MFSPLLQAHHGIGKGSIQFSSLTGGCKQEHKVSHSPRVTNDCITKQLCNKWFSDSTHKIPTVWGKGLERWREKRRRKQIRKLKEDISEEKRDAENNLMRWQRYISCCMYFVWDHLWHFVSFMRMVFCQFCKCPTVAFSSCSLKSSLQDMLIAFGKDFLQIITFHKFSVFAFLLKIPIKNIAFLLQLSQIQW